MKRPLNNQKCCLFNEKIRKSYATFSENKPNVKNIKIGVSSFEISKYETLSAWRSENQTQFKPIQTQFWANIKGGKPKQTQNKPKTKLGMIQTHKYLKDHRISYKIIHPFKDNFTCTGILRGPTTLF